MRRWRWILSILLALIAVRAALLLRPGPKMPFAFLEGPDIVPGSAKVLYRALIEEESRQIIGLCLRPRSYERLLAAATAELQREGFRPEQGTRLNPGVTWMRFRIPGSRVTSLSRVTILRDRQLTPDASGDYMKGPTRMRRGMVTILMWLPHTPENSIADRLREWINL